MLAPLPDADQARLVEAMRTVETLIGGGTTKTDGVVLRPHRPGDMGWVIHRHAALYAQEYGWDNSFEAMVAEASRQIRTGNVQDSANPQAAFAALLYGNLQNLIACENVVIDVRRFASFSTVNYPEYVDTDGNAANAQFVPGNPGDVVLVRVTYRWQLLTPFLDHLMADTGSTKFLGAAALFRNEPYRGPIG